MNRLNYSLFYNTCTCITISGSLCDEVLCDLDCGARAECVVSTVDGTNVQECVCVEEYTGPNCTEEVTGIDLTLPKITI